MTKFFEKEIQEQPHIIQQIIDEFLALQTFDFGAFKRIILIASGTSKNAADFGAYYFEQIAKIPAKTEFASEVLQKELLLDEDDLVVFISQSGKSTDVLLAMDKVKRFQAKILAITNKIDSKLALGADFVIDMKAGEELAIPATKSFSATVVLLYILAIYFAQKKGLDVQKLISDLKSLPKAIFDILEACDFDEIALSFDSSVFLGRGLFYFAFNEISLKLKEAALLKTTSFPLGEYVHGHMVTLKHSDSITVASLSSEEIHKTDCSLIKRIRENYGVKTVLIDEKLFTLSSKFLTPLLMVILYQLVACEIAKRNDINADKPTGLNKVTE